MEFLDDKKTYEKLDTGMVAESISMLPDQIEDVISEIKDVKLPKRYSDVNKIVVAGMGGSNLGYRIIRSAFKQELKVPLIIEAGYLVPKFVDKNTLFILSSYSGNTEEVLSVYKEAKKRKAKILAVTSDSKPNKLFNLIKKDKIPGYVFGPDKNPSGEPRLGLGYSIFGSMALFEKAGLLKINKKSVNDLIQFLRKEDIKLERDVLLIKNKAKEIAKKLYKKNITLVGSELFEGNLHTSRNEFCECSKNFASYLEIPDMNHFALEGLSFPKSNQKDMIFFFFNSALYHKRTSERVELTKQVVKKNKIDFVEYSLKGETNLVQVFEMLHISTWVSYYLAMLNNQNPLFTPWVRWFKDKLKK